MKYSDKTLREAGTVLSDWFDGNGRDLPWRHTRDPYEIWVSEVMLQQTRVETVLRYYEPFLEAFPDLHSLAAAPEEAVLKAWEGLGYYRRARYLQRGARVLCENRNGIFPDTPEELKKIPGIGDYCAGSIASLAFGKEVPAVDGNVLRVLSRIWGIEAPVDRPEGKKAVADLAARMIPPGRVWSFNQSLMELGALVCLPGVCREDRCPVRELCRARMEGKTDTLPRRSARKQPETIRRTVWLCVRDGRILIRRRSGDEGLLAGLWEFPGEDEGSHGWKWDRNGDPAVRARHVFTHRIWEMEGYEVSWPEGRKLPPDCRWADRDDLALLPFPGAMKAFLAWADENID